MRRWIGQWLLALVLLALVLVTGGLLLPRQFSVERMTTVQAPPAVVYELLADPRRWKDWTAWYRRDRQMQLTYRGPAQGAGAEWAWASDTEGAGRLRVTAADPTRRVAYELHLDDWNGPSTGELMLRAKGTGTEVRWTLSGDLGGNPLRRWGGLLMDRIVGKDFDLGLSGLKDLAEHG